MRLIRVVLFFVLGLCSAVAPAHADQLFDTVLAQVRADQSTLWSMSRMGLDYTADGAVKSKKLAQFDGTQSKDDRWSLVAVDGQVPTDADASAFHKLFRDNPFPPTYGSIANFIDTVPERVEQSGSLAKYRLKTLPANTTLIRGHDFSKYLSGEMIIDQSGEHPYIKEVRIFAATPFKPIIGVKVEHLERVMHYAPTAQGQIVQTDSLSSGDGNAFFVPIHIHAQSFFSHHKDHTLVAVRAISSEHRAGD